MLAADQGEKYEDMAKLAVRDKLKSRERFIEPRGFVPSSPARQRCVRRCVDVVMWRSELVFVVTPLVLPEPAPAHMTVPSRSTSTWTTVHSPNVQIRRRE